MSELTEPRQKWALLIGIDTYPNLVDKDERGAIVKRRDLFGCVNDVRVMRRLLEEHYGFPPEHVTLLTEEAATRAGILAAFQELTDRVDDDDVVVVAYAGHGSQRPDMEGDEPDGKDSTLVPYDSGRAFPYNETPNRDITDDEIYLWLLDLTRKTSNVTLIFDSCHSGTITRDDFGEALRSVEPDTRSADSPIPQEDWPRLQARMETSSGWLPGHERYVLISSCRDSEQAGEYRVPGTSDRHGLMTYFLAHALQKATPGTTYRDVFEGVVPNVLAQRSVQHPQIEGTLDRELFGVRDICPMPYVQVTVRTGDTVTLAAGAAQGMTVGSEWTVYPEGTKAIGDETNALGRVQITAVQSVASEAIVAEEATDQAMQPGARAVETGHAVGNLAMRVQVHVPEARAEQATHFEEVFEHEGFGRLLRLVGPGNDGSEADARIYLIPPRQTVEDGDPVPQLGPLTKAAWAAVGLDGKLLMPPRAEQERDAVHTVLDNLNKIAKVRRLNAIVASKPSSPLDGQVRLTLKRRQPGGSWTEAMPEKGGLPVFKAGDRVEVSVVNEYSAPVYIYLFNIGLDYSVDQIFPPPGAHEVLAPQQSFDVGRALFGPEGIPLYIPETFPFVQDPADAPIDEGVDTALLFATLEEADFRALRQEGVRAVEQVSHLEDLLRGALHGEATRNFGKPPPAQEPWTAVTANFILQR